MKNLITLILAAYLAPTFVQGNECVNGSGVERHALTKTQRDQVVDILKIMQEVEKKKRLKIKNKKPKAIIIQRAAELNGISHKVLAAVIAVESEFRTDAVNRRSKDYGIAQINIYNIRARGLDKKRLVSDAEYGVKIGAKILKEKKSRFSKRESKWLCRYNVGTAPKLRGKRLKKCLTYYKKVAKYI